MKLKKYSDRFYLLLLALLVSLPFSIFFNSLLIALLLVNTFTAPRAVRRRAQLGHPLVLSYLLFFAAYLASLLYTQDIPQGLGNVETKLSFLIMPLVLAVGAPTTDSRRRNSLLICFGISVLAASLFSVALGFYEYLSTGTWYRYYPNGDVRDHHLFYTGLSYPLMHPGYFSVYVGSAIFIFWQHLLSAKKKLLPVAAIIFLFIFLILLQGRINILAFFLISFVYLIVKVLQQKRYKLFAVGTASLILLALAVTPLLPANVKKRFAEPPSFEYDISAEKLDDFSGLTIRFAEWHSAIPVIRENPIFGVGAGDAHRELMKSYEEEGFTVGRQRGFNSHNQFLQTLLATGILGLIPLMAILVSLLVISIKNKDLLLGMLTLYFFLSSLTEAMLERHWAVSFFCSLLLYLGLSSRRTAGRDHY